MHCFTTWPTGQISAFSCVSIPPTICSHRGYPERLQLWPISSGIWLLSGSSFSSSSSSSSRFGIESMLIASMQICMLWPPWLPLLNTAITITEACKLAHRQGTWHISNNRTAAHFDNSHGVILFCRLILSYNMTMTNSLLRRGHVYHHPRKARRLVQVRITLHPRTKMLPFRHRRPAC